MVVGSHVRHWGIPAHWKQKQKWHSWQLGNLTRFGLALALEWLANYSLLKTKVLIHRPGFCNPIDKPQLSFKDAKKKGLKVKMQ